MSGTGKASKRSSGGSSKGNSEASSSSKSAANIKALFDTLCDPDDPETITMEGCGRLGETLGMDPSTDVRLLVLLWRLSGTTGFKTPGTISLQEFTAGMNALGKDSIVGMRGLLPSLDPGFLERPQFRGEKNFNIHLFSQFFHIYKT